MKIVYFSFLLLGFLLNSCKDNIELPCHELREGLAETDKEAVANILNDLLKDLPSVPTDDDVTGHRTNLDLFVERLNDQCGFEANVECYACVYTFPPISHVWINLDSSGVNIRRILDIRTPEADLMTVTNVHF